MFYVYAIKSKRSGRIYIGQTQNLMPRLESHNKGYVRSTKKDRPWDLISIEELRTRDDGRWRERELKKSLSKRLHWLQRHHRGKKNAQFPHLGSEGSF